MPIGSTADSFVRLPLGNLPEIEGRELYNALLELYDAAFILAGAVDLAGGRAVTTVTTVAYTAAPEDATILLDATANAVTVTLPTAVGLRGWKYTFKCINATFLPTVDAAGSETIDGVLTQFFSLYSYMVVQSDGSNWYIVG